MRRRPTPRRMPCSPGSMKALEAELPPHRVHPALYCVIHDDRPAPGARRLARPFVGGVDAELRTEAGNRAREIEVVDGSAFGDEEIARRVHPRADRPDDFLPVAHVDVL